MSDQLEKLQLQAALSDSQIEHHDIRIVGPRRSGKTTFMAALAYWPNASPDSPVESVVPFDDETTQLVHDAQNILEGGLQLAGTRYFEDPEDSPLYTVLIDMKPGFGVKDNQFQVSCRDYPGEMLQELWSGNGSNPKLSTYLDDCADASALLILLDGSTHRDDKMYAQAFEQLKTELNFRLTGQGKSLNEYRIALGFAKAEQARVWIHRHDIQKFINLRFPKTRDSLQKWGKDWGCPVNHFFCSAFGMKGTPPKPNVRVEQRERGTVSAVIDRPQFWRPFGLISPLYWLHTGKDNPKLRQIKD